MGTTNVIEEPYRLTSSDAVISSANGAAASLWYDVWTYQAPNGVALILKPTDTFSAYLDYGTGSSEDSITATRIKIEKRDPSKSDVQLIFGPTLYKECREFSDINTIAHIQLPDSTLVLNEREFLIISVYYSAQATVAAYSYFVLHTTRVRKAIGS
jgi:hypothetical protein